MYDGDIEFGIAKNKNKIKKNRKKFRNGIRM